MSLPAQQLDAPARSNWTHVNDAARLFGCNADHLRRRCRIELSGRGMAKKIDGEWHLHANSDMRLRGITTADEHDRITIGELTKEGVRPAYIRVAEQRRAIVLGFATFPAGTAGVNEAAKLYCAHLISSGAIPPDDAFAPRTLFDWRSNYEKGGLRALVPGYGGPRDKNAIGPQAWRLFLEARNSPGNRTSVSEAYAQVLGFIKEMHYDGLPDWRWPALRTVQARFAAEPEPFRVYNDLGPHKWRAEYLPKIARDYEDVPAGDVFCGDERTLDFMVRVPSAKGWKRVRPKLTAWLDVRSRMVVGWIISEWANSDTIVASFRMGCEQAGTTPLETIMDNGSDYKAVGGKRGRKWDEFDTSRLQTTFERLGVVAHYALKRHPYSKMIESHFRTLKDFDRWCLSFWGGTPEERPFDADEWTRKHVAELPTIDEVRTLFAEWLEAHHEKRQTGSGMFELCPRQAFRQFFTTTPRRATPETLRSICAHLVEDVLVGRDGVRVGNLRYGAFNESVFKLRGKTVCLLVDPIDASFVTICDKHGVEICRADANRNHGATREEVRAAQQQRRKMERVAKQYAGEARGYLMKTPLQQIIHRRKLAAQAQQIPDAALPPPAELVAVKMVRPDIAEGAERVRRASGAEAIRRLTEANAGAAAINAGVRRNIDFAQFANSEDVAPVKSTGRVLDFARLAAGRAMDSEPDVQEVQDDVTG